MQRFSPLFLGRTRTELNTTVIRVDQIKESLIPLLTRGGPTFLEVTCWTCVVLNNWKCHTKQEESDQLLLVVSKIRWMPRLVDKEVSVRGRAVEKLITRPEGFTD